MQRMKIKNLVLLLLALNATALTTWADEVNPAYTPGNYTALTAEQKSQVVERMLDATEYKELRPGRPYPTANPGALDMLKLFAESFLRVVFDLRSDEMPAGRKKLIHTYGSVALVEFRANPSTNLTGIFHTGALGVARLSIATTDQSKFAPGMGLKFLVNGKESENIISMYSLDGQGSEHNFFRNNFSNVINPPSQPGIPERALVAAFQNALHERCERVGSDKTPESELNLPLHEVAMIDRDGNSNRRGAISPFQIYFVPTREAKISIQSALPVYPDFRESLEQGIGAGTVIYKVRARLLRDDQESIELGDLVTRSRFYTSEYGDTKLNFRHSSTRSTR